MNKIALTFDDGPNPFWTLKVANVLDKYGVKGNFFVIGKWAEKYPDIVRELFWRGHLIGNHSYSHSQNTDVADMLKADKVITEITGETLKFVRFPYLVVNFPFIKNAYFAGKKIVDCDVNPVDYTDKRCLEIAMNVISMAEAGSIILLHDGSDKEKEMETRPEEMVKALPKIIESLIAKDFKIVTLEEYYANSN